MDNEIFEGLILQGFWQGSLKASQTRELKILEPRTDNMYEKDFVKYKFITLQLKLTETCCAKRIRHYWVRPETSKEEILDIIESRML